MSQRYEVEVADRTTCELIGPDTAGHSLWDTDLPPTRGQRALVIGDPWAGAYAVVGDLDQLARFAARLTSLLHAARATQPPPHQQPAVVYDPAALRGWLARHADRYHLGGSYTSEHNIADTLAAVLPELRGSPPQVWRTAADVHTLAVYPTALLDGDLADFGVILTVELLTVEAGLVRLATGHLPAPTLSGHDPNSAEHHLPLLDAAYHAVTTAAAAVNHQVARWRHAHQSTAAP